MQGLSAGLLGRACRTFLGLAYPGGAAQVPAAQRPYLHLAADTPLGALLLPPLCRALPAPGGGTRGYSFRLGCAHYPHLKLQVVAAEGGECVFTVDTHDAAQLDAGPADAARWGQLQAANRELKGRIERAWEAAGLLTFNGLLRRELERR